MCEQRDGERHQEQRVVQMFQGCRNEGEEKDWSVKYQSNEGSEEEEV